MDNPHLSEISDPLLSARYLADDYNIGLSHCHLLKAKKARVNNPFKSPLFLFNEMMKAVLISSVKYFFFLFLTEVRRVDY